MVVYAWLPPEELTVADLEQLVGWTRRETAALGKLVHAAEAGAKSKGGGAVRMEMEAQQQRGNSLYGGWNAGIDCSSGAGLLRPGRQADLLRVCRDDLPMPQ